jgi:hypothetical protein
VVMGCWARSRAVGRRLVRPFGEVAWLTHFVYVCVLRNVIEQLEENRVRLS